MRCQKYIGSLVAAFALAACHASPLTSRTGANPDVTPSWQIALGRPIHWMPLFLETGGRAKVIVAPDSDEVVALDARNGRLVWRFANGRRLWADSVAVLGDAVFVAGEGAEVILLDGATGLPRWRRSLQPTDATPLTGLEARSKPVLSGDAIYVPTAGVGSRARVNNARLHAPLVALDFKTGREVWRFQSDSYILRAPAADAQAGVVYVGGNGLSSADIDEGGAMRIYALDQNDGRLLWIYQSSDGLIKSLWAGGGRLVFVAYRDFLVGLDAAAGVEVYRRTTGNWVQSFTPLPLTLAPSGLPALAYGAANAFLNLADPRDGRLIWQYNVEGTFNYPIGNAVSDGRTIYFISQRGDLHALDARTGALRWRRATGIEARDGPALGAGHLFVTGADGLVSAFRLP